jgi:hypothetical protein
MVGGAVGRHRMMQTRTSLVFAKDSGKKKKTPLLHPPCSAVLVCLDSTRFVRDGMTAFPPSWLIYGLPSVQLLAPALAISLASTWREWFLPVFRTARC